MRTPRSEEHTSALPIYWKKQLLDGIESLFRDGRRRDHDETQAIQAELYEQIGRLKMELEWLKKKLPASIDLKRPLIEPLNNHLSVRRQCELLDRKSTRLPFRSTGRSNSWTASNRCSATAAAATTTRPRRSRPNSTSRSAGSRWNSSG